MTKMVKVIRASNFYGSPPLSLVSLAERFQLSEVNCSPEIVSGKFQK